MICATCHTEIRPGQESTPSLLRKSEIQHAWLGGCLDNLRTDNEQLRAAAQLALDFIGAVTWPDAASAQAALRLAERLTLALHQRP
jgi:hypothetical protein